VDTQPIVRGSYGSSNARLGGANPYPQGSVIDAIVELGNSVVSSITSMGTDTKYVELRLNNRGPNTGGAGNGLTLVGGLAGYRINFPGTADAGTAGVQGTLGMISGVSWNSGSPVVFSNGLMMLSNGNGITFGGSIDGNSLSLTGSSAGVKALAAGTQTATSGTVVFSNSNGVTFGMSGSSQVTANWGGVKSVAAGGSTIPATVVLGSADVNFGIAGVTVTAAPFRVSMSANSDSPIHPEGRAAITQQPGVGGSSSYYASFQRLSFANALSATRFDIVARMFGTASTASSIQTRYPGGSITIVAAIYTINNSTIGSVSSASTQISWERQFTDEFVGTEWYRGQSGWRWRSMSLADGGWNVTPGEYMVRMHMSMGALQSADDFIYFEVPAAYYNGGPGVPILPPGVSTIQTLPYFANGVYSATVNVNPTTLGTVHVSEIQSNSVAQPYFRLIGSA